MTIFLMSVRVFSSTKMVKMWPRAQIDFSCLHYPITAFWLHFNNPDFLLKSPKSHQYAALLTGPPDTEVIYQCKSTIQQLCRIDNNTPKKIKKKNQNVLFTCICNLNSKMYFVNRKSLCVTHSARSKAAEKRAPDLCPVVWDSAQQMGQVWEGGGEDDEGFVNGVMQ